MKRISPISLACLTLLLVPLVAAATPNPNSAVLKTRIFNDCPVTTLTTVNNYPELISFEDVGLACSGFANLHNWTFSTDGVDGAVFNNDSDFSFSTDLVIVGKGEAGLRISPWWSKDADGLFNVRSTDGEIACFGGRLPFYSFTGAHGLHYSAGDPIHLEMTYKPRGLNATEPATIEYVVTYQGNTYSSGNLNYDMANPAEDPPYGLWGMLNDGRVGGHLKAFMTPGDFSAATKVTFTNIRFVVCPVVPTAVTKTRVFNDCPVTTLSVTNDYPDLVSFTDVGLACSGFANLHNWSVSEDGVNQTVFNNGDDFRIAMDMVITGKGEGGIRISPWWGKDADGLFNVRSTDGEIACFGGRLPFYTFTGAHGLHYAMGDLIHLEAIYRHNGLSAADPGTIEYKVSYLGTDYSSGVLNFDMGNPAEDPPYGLWGILNDARVGGHTKAFMTPGDFTATTTTTFTNIVVEYAAGAPVVMDFEPGALNLNASGNFVTVLLEPQAPYAAADIDIGSLRLNGQVLPSDDFMAELGDDNGNGIADLKLKFNRMTASNAIAGSGVATVTGEVGGRCFEASDPVKVIPVHSPAGGATIAGGQVVDVRWSTPPGVSASTVDIYYSSSGGEAWALEAQGVPNTGSYAWQAPGNSTYRGRVAVVMNNSIAGFSGEFSINGTVGVGDPGSVAFALKGVTPNPAKSDFNVQFSLPDGKRATLSLFDVSGRRLASRDVGSLGAGRHTVNLAKKLPAGLYLVRLDREGASLTTRAAVVR